MVNYNNPEVQSAIVEMSQIVVASLITPVSENGKLWPIIIQSTYEAQEGRAPWELLLK